MTYVMSDLHGVYKKYIAMLELMKFGPDDTLYILGDVCDRGDDSAKIYLAIMNRSNVFCIKGNHEQMLEESLPKTFGWLSKFADPELYDDNPELWDFNGGDKTKLSFLKLGEKENIIRIYKYVRNMPYYLQVNINDKTYTLAHAGGYIDNIERNFSEYSSYELIWDSPAYDSVFDDRRKDVLIVGHTPTFILDRSNKAKIYFGKGNIINVDCGAYFEESGGRLGCLCLETMQEYYI